MRTTISPIMKYSLIKIYLENPSFPRNLTVLIKQKNFFLKTTLILSKKKKKAFFNLYTIKTFSEYLAWCNGL